MHERFHRCASFVAHDSHEEALRWLYAPNAAAPQPEAYTVDNAATVNAIVAHTAAANIVSTIQQLSSYHTRYYTTQTGYDAAAWLRSHWAQIGQGRSDVSVTFFDHPTWLQHSVIATIQGTDFPKEVVVLGAHLDSIRSGQATTGQAPGADDDASGIASLTETFRAAIAAGYRPARTVKFMGYAGEEAGLRGSKEIATAMNPNTGLTKLKVIGAFQLDMTNFKSSAPDAVDVGILNDASFTNGLQNVFVKQLLDAYQPSLTVNTTSTCGYGCSDHAAWNVQGGVPASIAFEGKFGQHSQLLHTANDTLANADPTCAHALKFTKLAAAYMAELAKGVIVP
jgi:leucyl aminopeptidase